MSKEEMKMRFQEMEDARNFSIGDNRILLSSDGMLGLLLEYDSNNLVLFGNVKLTKPIRELEMIDFGGLVVDNRNLMRALNVLRRRRYFEVGYFIMPHLATVAIKNGEAIIIIAPVFFRYSSKMNVVKIEDITVGLDRESMYNFSAILRVLHHGFMNYSVNEQ